MWNALGMALPLASIRLTPVSLGQFFKLMDFIHINLVLKPQDLKALDMYATCRIDQI